MASPNLSEILTTTLRHRSKKLKDAVSNNTALLKYITKSGNQRPVPGGRTIVEEVEYAENPNYTRYSGAQPIAMAAADVLTAAEYNWKQAALTVQITGLEERQNSGREALISLIGARVRNAERTFMNKLSEDLYSDGSALNQINGLQALVSDAGTGTIGGINSSTWAFWQNQITTFTGLSLTASSTTITQAMNNLWAKLVRNSDAPNLIIADNTYWIYYLESLQAIHRISSSSEAEAGYSKLKYMSADVILDGGMGGNSPAAHMYFLNTNHLHWRPHTDCNMTVLGGDRQPVNQDATVKIIGWMGNLTTGNRMLQGVLSA